MSMFYFLCTFCFYMLIIMLHIFYTVFIIMCCVLCGSICVVFYTCEPYLYSDCLSMSGYLHNAHRQIIICHQHNIHNYVNGAIGAFTILYLLNL